MYSTKWLVQIVNAGTVQIAPLIKQLSERCYFTEEKRLSATSVIRKCKGYFSLLQLVRDEMNENPFDGKMSIYFLPRIYKSFQQYGCD